MVQPSTAVRGGRVPDPAPKRNVPRLARPRRYPSLVPVWGIVLTLCAFTLLFMPGLWVTVWSGGLPHSWDGSGQYAVARLYAQSIFPDTFGWLRQFAAGMPFPNYYPPLFHWLVAALANWARLPFNAAFKAILLVSALSLPLAIWRFAKSATRSNSVALLAAVAAFPLLFDKRSYYPLVLLR